MTKGSSGSSVENKGMVMRISSVIISCLIFLTNNCFACHTLEEDKGLVITQKTKLYVPFQYSLEDLPNELINQTVVYLSPVDILTFSHVSKRIKRLLNNNFWLRYIDKRQYELFDETVYYFCCLSYKKRASPAKIALANYYYKIGSKSYNKKLIKHSASLGLPKAKQYLKKYDDNPHHDDYYSFGHTPNVYRPYRGFASHRYY